MNKKTGLTAVVAGLLALSSAASQAATFDFTGSISTQKDIITVPFTLNADTFNVSVWTDSYKDGLNFDPITAVWQQTGSTWSLVGENDDNSSIKPDLTRFDSGIYFNQLSAGSYLFTIAAYNNFANGSELSQGFKFDNETPVALADWDQPASHRGMGSVFSVHLEGVDQATAPVPEPETYALMGVGLLGLFASRRRNKTAKSI
jgi:hypothetical protein